MGCGSVLMKEDIQLPYLHGIPCICEIQEAEDRGQAEDSGQANWTSINNEFRLSLLIDMLVSLVRLSLHFWSAVTCSWPHCHRDLVRSQSVAVMVEKSSMNLAQ